MESAACHTSLLLSQSVGAQSHPPRPKILPAQTETNTINKTPLNPSASAHLAHPSQKTSLRVGIFAAARTSFIFIVRIHTCI